MKTWLDKLRAEQQAATTSELQIRFIWNHPILCAIGLLMKGASYLVKAGFWLLMLAGLVVGLKCLWLGVQWLWGLI